MLQKSLYIVCLMNNSVRWIKFSVLVIIWLQNIAVVKIKVVMYTTGDCIYFVSRFLIVISGSTFDSKKIYDVVSCVLHYSFFFDSSSSDNTACLRRSASNAKCTVNGAIIRAHRERVRLWSRRVKNGVHPTQPDPTQNSPVSSFHRYYRVAPFY